jgi:plasmid maintenance system antidote protein VapI
MDQWLALQKDWELTLRKQTKDILQQRRAQYAEELKRQRKMQAQQTGRTESGLIVHRRRVQ